MALPPRPTSAAHIPDAFTRGSGNKPQTRSANVKADVLAHYVPSFVRGDFGAPPSWTPDWSE
ncbi:hypothetical protein GCM10018952_05880 [Streptosporangium vulgare]